MLPPNYFMKSPFREPTADAWHRRYGTDAPPELPDLGTVLNHRSVRKFRPDPIPAEVRQALIAAAQSAATSSNLQLWSVIEVDDPERREKIAQLCSDQKQVRTAAWFLAFIADHHRLRQAAAAVGEEALGLDYAEFCLMSIIDATLAAERMVVAAETLGIGTCYIGSLRNDPVAIKDLLGLPTGTIGVFGLCLGYPEEPVTAEVKPRLGQDAVWFKERYSADVSEAIADYDLRMRAFYEAQKMKGDATWSMRSGRRVDEHHLGGREAILDFLHEQGFLKR